VTGSRGALHLGGNSGPARIGGWAGLFALFAVLPLFLPSYLQGLLTKTLIFALFALSLNMLMGNTGLFSLGHAAYFGVAGYTASILLNKLDVHSAWIVAPVSILAAAVTAALFGTVALRVSGVYFLAITLALGQLLYSAAVKWRTVTGGTNGSLAPRYPDFGLGTMTTQKFYYFVLLVCAGCTVMIWIIQHSPFGLSTRGIRDNEARMKSLGFHVWAHKYVIFILAGTFAGVAGWLFRDYSGVMVPDYLGVTMSTTVMLMVIVGGERVFWGPIIGAFFVTLIEYYASIYMPARWPMLLGVIFVVSVMYLRGGVAAAIGSLWTARKKRSGSSAA
jgi:branched-chain amino acid transport system permease protein